jgi:hypothetical protein
MRTINKAVAAKISGNVEGNNCIGTVAVVLYNSKRAGLTSVVLSRPGCQAVGDEDIFGDDRYITVTL